MSNQERPQQSGILSGARSRLHGDDLHKFDQGYDCQRAQLEGDWSITPPTEEDRRHPAFLLGSMLFLASVVAPRLSPQGQLDENQERFLGDWVARICADAQ